MRNETYSTIVKVLIASIVGTIIISAGFYIILFIFIGQQQALSQQYQSFEVDMGPGSLFYGFLTVALFIVSAMVTGFIADLLGKWKVKADDKSDRFISSLKYSIPSGFITGILLWLAYGLLSPIVLADNSSLMTLESILLRLSSTIIFFIVIALLIAILAMLGGFAYEILSPIIRRKKVKG
jgi:H+/Cl- antiporter ClcA